MSKEYSSFRDPSGYIYKEDGCIYRKINKCYISVYDFFMQSGLYERLVKDGLIVSHEEIKRTKDYVILKVQKIPFISYPYEWCFEQFKDAALLTLDIQMIAMEYGMYLKDASAYNVQFLNGRPIFIDTLSFDIYEDGMPWGAYGQFTRHFLAPLLLMKNIDGRLGALMSNYIDGIPLDMTDALLKGRGGFFAMQHIKWQNRSIEKHNNSEKTTLKRINISKDSLFNFVFVMRDSIARMKQGKFETEWDCYYDNTNYSSVAENDKRSIISDFLKKIDINSNDIAIDLGANDGYFSRLIKESFGTVVSADIDINCVERNYLNAKKNNENILPLILDFNNPSSSIGFACRERESFESRSNVKCVMSLALIHHMAISNNVPLLKCAEWLSSLGEYLIIEFVPKNDSQVELLLNTRKDIFDDYTTEIFEDSFGNFYKIIDKKNVVDSKRYIYLMVRK